MTISKPMLAGTINSSNLTKLYFPYLASPKLDGIRAIVKGGVLLSRNMEPIRNHHTQKLFGDAHHEGFDGELIVGPANSPTCMRDTSSGVMSYDGKPRVTFNVFDDYTHEGTFLTRIQRVEARVKRMKRRSLVMVPHVQVASMEELQRLEEEHLARGFEGTMLRCPRGPYKQGRSTVNEGWLLKLKRFMDSEAEIIDVQEMNHNDNVAVKDARGYNKRSTIADGLRAAGVLGSFLCRDIKGGETFNVGSGFTTSERTLFWASRSTMIGRLIKYKFFPQGSKERPRFPVFMGFRDKADMD